MNRFLAIGLATLLFAATAPADDISGLLAPLHIAPAPAGSGYGYHTAAPAKTVSYITEQDVITSLATAMTERFPVDGGQLRLTFAHPFTRVRLTSDDEWQLTLNDTPPGGMTSNMIVSFTLTQGDKRIGSWNCLVRAQLWKPVLISERRLERGMTVDKEIASERVVDVLRAAPNLVPGGTDLSGYEMAETVNAGLPLTWHDVTAKPTVRKGQVVDISAADGLVSISMKAVAMANGAVGDMITVRNIESRRDFPAKVTGINTAQVAF